MYCLYNKRTDQVFTHPSKGPYVWHEFSVAQDMLDTLCRDLPENMRDEFVVIDYESEEEIPSVPRREE